jgi:Erv1 / Alr family
LPCPECASHAKMYLDSSNINSISNKEELKQFLYVFHNTVNTRKGYPIFTIEELNNKYSNAVTINIINNFLYFFSDKSRSPKMIAGDLHRTRLTSSIKDWLNQYLYCFSH